MVKNNYLILICSGVLICLILYFYILPLSSTTPIESNQHFFNRVTYNAPYGKLIIAANISDNTQNVTHYLVTPQKYDMIDYWNWNPVNKDGNVTTETDAPLIAEKILDNYGGIPHGAGPLEAHTEYLEGYDPKTLRIIERIPDSTVIDCQRSLDGKPVIGGYIRMELGKNGELLNLKKVWRTVTPAGTIQVIPASEALQKILQGDILNVDRPKCTCDLTVDKVILAYRENGYNQTQEYLEPVWDFKGTLSSGGSYRYLVSALKSPENNLRQHTYLITEVYAPQAAPDDISDNQSIATIKGNTS